uniref:DDE-type integrase/transposase/recombinase n=1 Tax=Microbispora cellulosiformans TaxID=2614688 RepID=UPI001CDA12D5|nr:DDE-type integrase/transposase/recombinase [Microbispora cellulosiformans]
MQSRATISRYPTRAGLVTEPSKRPRSSYIRCQAEQPNETWQADFTHYRLADGSDAEILTWLDDHSRYALSVTAHPRLTGPIVRDTFRHATAAHGVPASTLTDNDMVFTTRLAGGRGGRNAFESELRRLHVTQKNFTPQPPHHLRKSRTLTADHEEMATHPAQSAPHHRPHRSPPHQATPAAIYTNQPKAQPAGSRDGDTHIRVRVVTAATGELLRELTIDATRDYQPQYTKKPPNP